MGFAACSKEDIEFYLDKGFSQEQITQLCSASQASVPDYQPYQQKVIIYSTEEAPGVKGGFTREERKAIKTLDEGADVVNLEVDQNFIKYTSVICLADQQGKEHTQRFKDCPPVDFVMNRYDIEISASGKKYGFFGKQFLTVKGDIKRTMQGSFDDYPPQFRKQLERQYNWKANRPEIDFPIRGDYSVTKVYNALTDLTKISDDATTLAQSEKENDEQTVEINETEKKKRWWNPFD